MQLTLRRFNYTDDGVMGVLLWGTEFICFTLEEEWKENAKGVSCIPAGLYRCTLYNAPKHGTTYLVNGVPGRSAILFHTGNTEADTEGCILTGLEFGEMDAVDDESGIKESQLAILRSREGYTRFRNKVGQREAFDLIIDRC